MSSALHSQDFLLKLVTSQQRALGHHALSSGERSLCLLRQHTLHRARPLTGQGKARNRRADAQHYRQARKVCEAWLLMSTSSHLAIHRLSTPQGLLECTCLERFVSRLGHPNTFLKSVARTQVCLFQLRSQTELIGIGHASSSKSLLTGISRPTLSFSLTSPPSVLC